MKSFILVWLLSLISFSAFTQAEIRGRVLDEQTGEPLAFASIYAPDKQTGTTSDHKGNFRLLSPLKIDSLYISLIGYKSKKIEVGEEKFLLILLQAEILNMQEVVITANREMQERSEVPTAIHRVSNSLIEDTKPTLLPEVLNKVPGVVMVNLNNEQHAMSIRQPMGYNSYFLYLEDGIPVRPAGVFNHNALIEINTFAVNSIEVIKGPSSSLYGSEAIGGAINFITHKPTAIPTVRSGFQMDNYGYFRTQYSAGTYLNKNLGVYTGGYLARQRNGWQTSSDYDKLSLNIRADYYIRESTKLTAAISANDYDSEMGGSVDSAGFYSRKYISLADFTYRKVQAARARVTLHHYWNKSSEGFITFFYRKNSIRQFPSYSIRRVNSDPTLAHGEINENAFRSYGMIIQNSMKFKFLNSRLITGLCFDYSPNNYWAYYVKIDRDPASGFYTSYTQRPDSFLVNYNAKLLNSGVYSQYEFNPLKKLKIVLGLRYDRIDFHFDNHLPPSSFSGAPDENNNFNNFTPKAGAIYELKKGTGIYANFSRGFCPPTINQLYRGVKVPELKSAWFDNFEAGGWSYFFKKKVYMDWSIYQINGYNEIVNFLLPDNSRENRNSGKTLHRGIEYNITWSPDKQVFFRFGGSNAVHRFIQFSTKEGQNFDGNLIPNAPEWIANTEIIYKPPFIKDFRISLEHQRISSYYKDNENKFKYDDKTLFGFKGVSILNFRTGYKIGEVEVFVNILNLTNELYANIVTRGNFGDTYTPSSPRLYTFGLMYHLVGKDKGN
jgi:outer membrane receptor protein involved in Fe transport